MIKPEEEKFGLGIATFMGADYIDISHAGEYDVVFLGLPLETGASFRKGMSLAPNAIRQYSSWDRVDGATFVDIKNNQKVTANKLSIADLGDLPLCETDQNECIQKIIKYIGSIPQRSLPLVVGGDHSVTYSSFVGSRKRFPKNAKIALLHLDAHLDVENSYTNLPKIWHGNVIRKLISDNYIAPNDIYSVGVRGFVPEEWVNYAERNGINIFSAYEIMDHKEEVYAGIINRLKGYDLLYVSFDIDVLDTSYCPGTGVPSNDGLRPRDVSDLLKQLHDIRLIGFDMVELSPCYDVNGQTTMIACELLYELLAFGYRPCKK